MALPITPTPRLNIKESKEFLKKVEEGLKNPIGPVPTPKINKVVERIMDDARRGVNKVKKQLCDICKWEEAEFEIKGEDYDIETRIYRIVEENICSRCLDAEIERLREEGYSFYVKKDDKVILREKYFDYDEE